MNTPTKMVDGPHVLVPAGGNPRTVEVSGGGNVLTDGDDTYIWNERRRCYEHGQKIMRFYVEGQTYTAVDLGAMTAEVGTWS
jgi:hypothetical protein